MTSSAPPIVNITGPTLTLGPISHDLLPLYTRWINDFGTTRTLGSVAVGPMTAESEEDWYQRTARGERGVLFTMRERSTGRPIGNCGLNTINERNRAAVFGIMVGEPDARGKGYGTEAARLMLDYSFTALGLNSVSLTLAEFNPAALRAYTKAGFRECGRLRQTLWYAGRYWDTILMDCLAAEFDHAQSVLRDTFTPGPLS